MMKSSKLLQINKKDNVAVAVEPISKGERLCDITALDDVPAFHKILLTDVQKGNQIIKYGYPIGHATCDIKKGSHIHTHNIKTNLEGRLSYSFNGDNEYKISPNNQTFNGYLRANGDVGIRNEIWIVSTVGCISTTAKALEKEAQALNLDLCDGVYAFTHPYGCSQLGDDMQNTRKVLAGLVSHPNAGGVLVLSLGCEDTNIEELKKYIGNYDEKRVRFLVCQDVDDEIEEGLSLIREIYDEIKDDKRQEVGIDKLKIGFKCGGSDAFSGITANPLCGQLCDILTSFGATAILTEVPEMFGAEQILLDRCDSKQTFDDLVNMINSFKAYFESYGQGCSDNPSYGNKKGGITTLEEKSLGCIQKGGTSVVTSVLDYAQKSTKAGLNLLYGPGNDMVSATNLVASGAQIIVFTTGRGTPFGSPVPTIKVSTNTELYQKKPNWIDFNAQDNTKDSFYSFVLDVVNGKKTNNEIYGHKDIAIFKNGVVL